MEYKRQIEDVKGKPRLIIHGGAGNIKPANMSREGYLGYRTSLLTILTKTNSFMATPIPTPKSTLQPTKTLPSALEVATFAVTLLEDDPLFNSALGAVFTRDGINELEASVMVSRGFKKRGVGVTGLRRVRNPILLARRMLEAGEVDLESPRWSSVPGLTSDPSKPSLPPSSSPPTPPPTTTPPTPTPDTPSAQGHTLLHGLAAEALATQYALPLVSPTYFFTQRRWDEHVRALQREGPPTWSPDEYLPQGTCGAVCMDAEGTVCVATSTGGMTNKLTGRIGDTPVVGAGFWAEEWVEDGLGGECGWGKRRGHVNGNGNGNGNGGVELAGALKGFLADCFPSPWVYEPLYGEDRATTSPTTITRSFAASGTGNGDSFMRLDAVRTVAAMARWKPVPSAKAIELVAGPGGELQKSTGDRWGHAGEGEGGMIGIESIVERDVDGNVVSIRGEVIQAHNCGGMFRAWIDDSDQPIMNIFGNGVDEPDYSFLSAEETP